MPNNRLSKFIGPAAAYERSPLVVSFLSGKGGVGKSVTAFNLAATMARDGANCLVIDTDWYFGNQHILGNFIPRYSLADIIGNPELSNDAITTSRPNLSFLSSPSFGESGIEFDEIQFARFLGGIRERYASFDFIFIDTASGMVNLINLAANSSDINIIVLNPELTSISDAYGLFKYLVHSNKKISVHLLINRVQNNSEAAFIFQKLVVLSERFLDCLPHDAGYLLDDKAIIESVAQQKSIFEIDSKGGAVERFLYLSNLLWKEKPGIDRIEETKQATKINTPMVLADIKEE